MRFWREFELAELAFNNASNCRNFVGQDFPYLRAPAGSRPVYEKVSWRHLVHFSEGLPFLQMHAEFLPEDLKVPRHVLDDSSAVIAWRGRSDVAYKLRVLDVPAADDSYNCAARVWWPVRIGGHLAQLGPGRYRCSAALQLQNSDRTTYKHAGRSLYTPKHLQDL